MMMASKPVAPPQIKNLILLAIPKAFNNKSTETASTAIKIAAISVIDMYNPLKNLVFIWFDA
jgi:hypothetical protein